MDPSERWLLALGLTVAVETALALVLGGAARRRLLVDTPLLNLFTHPVATLAHQRLGVPFLAVEVAVVCVEAVGYALVTRLPWRRAVALSAVLNAVTASLSFLF